MRIKRIISLSFILIHCSQFSMAAECENHQDVKDVSKQLIPSIAQLVTSNAFSNLAAQGGTQRYRERSSDFSGRPSRASPSRPRYYYLGQNMGGRIDDFYSFGEQMIREHRTIVIGLECASACTMLADTFRNNVCVSPNARMSFHLAFNMRTYQTYSNTAQTYYSRPIQEWIESRHGLPANDGFITMEPRDVQRYWRTCSQTELHEAQQELNHIWPYEYNQ